MTNGSMIRDAAPTTWALLRAIFSLVATAERTGGPAAIVVPAALNGTLNELERAAAKTGRKTWAGDGERVNIAYTLDQMRTALATS